MLVNVTQTIAPCWPAENSFRHAADAHAAAGLVRCNGHVITDVSVLLHSALTSDLTLDPADLRSSPMSSLLPIVAHTERRGEWVAEDICLLSQRGCRDVQRGGRLVSFSACNTLLYLFDQSLVAGALLFVMVRNKQKTEQMYTDVDNNIAVSACDYMFCI